MSGVPSPRKVKKPDTASTGNPDLDGKDFDAETQKYLEEIDGCQNEIDLLNEQASEEILKIEQRFNVLRHPHFDKRAECIDKVPNFWFTAFTNHPDLSCLLDDNEEDCFRYLLKIEVHEYEDIRSGYEIDFHFEENPYFQNTLLMKEFQLGLASSLSIPIIWKSGMDLSHATEPSCTRTERKRHLDQRSFFAWYNDHSDPSSDAIAEIIKDDLWLNPLQYFLVSDVDTGNGMEEEADNDEDELSEGSVVGQPEAEEEVEVDNPPTEEPN